MRKVFRYLSVAALVPVAFTAALLIPVGWIELGCQGDELANSYQAIVPPDNRRPEARTLLTYPEWHIVHAYDDYAEVISDGDPHQYDYFNAVKGYWGSLCTLSKASAALGGMDTPTRQMVYVIGISFTVELGMKGLYEETVGRLFAAMRGEEQSPLDRLSALQARDYAAFLQQTPWYQWDFSSDVRAMALARSPVLRDSERSFALGIEWRSKAAYAGVIKAAVASAGGDELTLWMVVKGLTARQIEQFRDVRVLSQVDDSVLIETPRYRQLTHLLVQMADGGVEFVEIAGNDDILFTALSAESDYPEAMFSVPRQGYMDYRHLILIKVPELASTLRALDARGLRLEHVHDY